MVGLLPSHIPFVLDKFAELSYPFHKLLFGSAIFLFIFVYFSNILVPLPTHFLNIHSQEAKQDIGSFSSKGFDIAIPTVLCTQLWTPK